MATRVGCHARGLTSVRGYSRALSPIHKPHENSLFGSLRPRGKIFAPFRRNPAIQTKFGVWAGDINFPQLAFVILLWALIRNILKVFKLRVQPASMDGAFSADDTQAAAKREELFGRICPMYDLLNDLLSLGLHRAWKRNAVEMCEVVSGNNALDVCCGSGDLTRLLAYAVGPNGTVTGLDFAQPMLQYAANKTKTLHEQRLLDENSVPINWVKGDAMKPPFEDNEFDVATIGYGLRNVANPQNCLGEMSRIIKPGGKLVVLDFNNPTNKCVKRFQSFCLDRIVVPVASWCGLREEYAYLRPSIEKYPRGDELIKMATKAGFQNAEFQLVAGGLMGMLIASN